jgi:hypothetical protein
MRLFNESSMLGFTSLSAYEERLETTKQKIYTIKQEELDDYS